MVDQKRANRGFTLIEMLVVIVIIGILMALIIPTVMQGVDRGKITGCKNNLKRLHEAVMTYVAKYGTSHALAPVETGSNLWEKIATNPTDILTGNKGRAHDLLVCPIKSSPQATGNYKGPTSKWGETAQDAVVGCDRDGNHTSIGGGGSYVKKDARLEAATDNADAGWVAALAATAD